VNSRRGKTVEVEDGDTILNSSYEVALDIYFAPITMIRLGQTPIGKLISDSVYLASLCIRYEGTLNGEEIMSLPGMQDVIWRCFANMWFLLFNCRCPPPVETSICETCTCEYYQPETPSMRLQKVERLIKCALEIGEELLGLEGASPRRIEHTTDEEDEAIIESGGLVVPEGVIEDLMMANLLKD
jgi:hypothetical protein